MDAADAGEEADLVFSATPFYGESGGQVRRHRPRHRRRAEASVKETRRYPGEIIAHRAVVEGSDWKPPDLPPGRAEALRRDTMRNHSATHLLHQGPLPQELGDHVKQAGSIVFAGPAALRLHSFLPGGAGALVRIEARVNEAIRENRPSPPRS